jgi:hypothetical protein
MSLKRALRIPAATLTYVLSGFIKVANGATLTIQPGTKIVGDFEIPGSSLFILRGAKIMAEGTRERPIVFTSERPVGQRQPGDWGGVIIIGNGIINRTGPTQIEGTGTPANVNPPQFYTAARTTTTTAACCATCASSSPATRRRRTRS